MKMKKKLLAVLAGVCCLAASIPLSPVMADGQKVVTLGADLSDDQRETILRFFGVEDETLETLIITNEDERAHLADYIPLEQIGTRTYSCALVRPTTSGGIQVKTANLTYVTSNMIATVLSTSGVVNCEVLAASPFEVSGTGALTGILMAYESASGEELPQEKKDAATQELVTVTQVADEIGQLNATKVINNTKIEVVENNIDDRDEISNVVNNVTNEMNVTIDDEDRDLIVDLMEQIAQLEYDYNDMKTTLERVEDNIDEQLGVETESEAEKEAAEEESESEDADSILNNTDDSVFDADLIDSTTENDVPVQEETDDDSGLVITTSDTYSGDDGPEETAAESEAAEEPFDEDDGLIIYDDEASDAADADADDAGLSWDDSYSGDTEESAAAEEEAPAEEAEPAGEEAPAEDAEPDEEAQTAAAENISILDLTLIPKDETVGAGLNVLTIDSSRTDLRAGTGTLTLINDDSGEEIETIALDDSSKVSEETTGDGTEFRVYLRDGLAADTDYAVILDDGAFTNEDGTLAFTGSSDWCFSTEKYGIALQQSVGGISTDNAVTGTLTMDPETMGYAVIDQVSADGADVTDQVSLSAVEFTESASFEISFSRAGENEIHVSFYDSADSMNYVGDAVCTAEVE